MSHTFYIVDAGWNPVPCDATTWARWFESGDRTLAATTIDYDGTILKDFRAWPNVDEAGRADRPGAKGVVEVSTVFLGLNSSVDDTPLIWESLAFALEPSAAAIGGTRHAFERTSIDGSMRRYATRYEALAGHGEIVDFLEHYLGLRLPLVDDEGAVDLTIRYLAKLKELEAPHED